MAYTPIPAARDRLQAQDRAENTPAKQRAAGLPGGSHSSHSMTGKKAAVPVLGSLAGQGMSRATLRKRLNRQAYH